MINKPMKSLERYPTISRDRATSCLPTLDPVLLEYLRATLIIATLAQIQGRIWRRAHSACKMSVKAWIGELAEKGNINP